MKVTMHKEKTVMKKSPSTSIRFSLGFIGVIFLSLTLFCWLKPDDTFSASERRVLASAPKATPSSVLSGSFMTDFESYSTDQFPMRDAFRGIKTGAERFLFAKSEVNDLYYQDGYLAATAHKLNLQNLLFAADKINFIYDTYLADTGSLSLIHI